MIAKISGEVIYVRGVTVAKISNNLHCVHQVRNDKADSSFIFQKSYIDIV